MQASRASEKKSESHIALARFASNLISKIMTKLQTAKLKNIVD